MKLYDGDGGNAQVEFIQEAETGWEQLLDDAERHRTRGGSKYDYLRSLLPKLSGQAKKNLSDYLKKWDWKNEKNPNIVAAKVREQSRNVWRIYYKERAIHDILATTNAKRTAPPIRPDDEPIPIAEPDDLEEFFDQLRKAFQMAATNFLYDLNVFRGQPQESLTKLANRFDIISEPLIENDQMTARHLALHFVMHLPDHIRKKVEARMDKEDEKRWKKKLPRVSKSELLVMAQEAEGWLLESEAEKRAAGTRAKERDNEPYKYQMPPPPPKEKPTGEKQPMKDRLGPRTEGQPELRKCNNCGKVGHLARHCPDPPKQPDAAVLPAADLQSAPRVDLAGHKTPGATCTSCKKMGHVAAQCWTSHPEKFPQELARKRGGAMAAIMRKRQRAAEHTSPDYAFQGAMMAMTYIRPVAAMMQQRATRVAQPTKKALESAAQAPAKRVHFDATAEKENQHPAATPIPLDPLTVPLADTSYPDVPGVPAEYDYKERLPQSFPHGLPHSSLEPGATDQQYPPSYLFPDPPLGDGPELLMETPLQAVTHLQDAMKNALQLTGELAKSLWQKATDRERHFPNQLFPNDPELVPAVNAADAHRVHCTPVYLSNLSKDFDVEGYVPNETILDTGATKVMLSWIYAQAIGLTADMLQRGQAYVTASGAVEFPVGVTKKKLKFHLGRGTEFHQVLELEATVVDTKAYDVLLGVEFFKAAKGVYDAYTEKFSYRWEGADGQLLSHNLSAPCHSSTPPLVAYACFGGVISHNAELQDVQSAEDDIMLEDDNWGYHTSPLQLAAIHLRDLNLAVEREREVRVRKEVREHDQMRREHAAAQLSSVIPLALPPMHPSSQWLGDEVLGASPINTSPRQFSIQAQQDGLHVMELFGGIGLGGLRSALAANYSVRCYTYVDRDPTSRRIARATLAALQQQYPEQLPNSAIRSFDKRLPQDISQCSVTFLEGLLSFNGPVDLLAGSWECQSVSRAGRQRGAMDPRFKFFYDLVRIVNFFQREQASPMIYILENTYPGARVTPAVKKAGDLVQAFIGAPVIIDAADLGAAAHRVRLFWTNMMQPELLQAALPKLLTPSPPLSSILKGHHIPTMPGHSDLLPFAPHNLQGGARLCMPTVVSYLKSRAFRPKENGNPGEGEVFNTLDNIWEEPDAAEKELLLGYIAGDTAAPGVSEAERAIRLGRALEGNTMRWLGAMLHAIQA